MNRFATLALMLALPAAPVGAEIRVEDAYLLSSGPSAQSAAAFMSIVNDGPEDDRLVAASTPAAERTELHTHQEDAAGVMRMRHVPEGFDLPAGERFSLHRGGPHVMLLGLTGPLGLDAPVEMTLEFEHAGVVEIAIPVDTARPPSPSGH